MNSSRLIEISFQIPNSSHHISVSKERLDTDAAEASASTSTYQPCIDPHAYKYTGRHDHGILPEMKCKDHMSNLITAVLQAKAGCDSYLTSIINADIATPLTVSESTSGNNGNSNEINNDSMDNDGIQDLSDCLIDQDAAVNDNFSRSKEADPDRISRDGKRPRIEDPTEVPS